MANKKTKKVKEEKPAKSLTEALGINRLLDSERLRFFTGLLLFVASIYMTLSFCSYLNTGAADQSIIE